MYRCQICNAIVSSGVKCHKIIVATRKKEYPFRPKVNPGYAMKQGMVTRSGKTRDRMDDCGGFGWEIEKEINCCPKCRELQTKREKNG